LVHFRAYYSTNISRTVCELKNRRLETITNLLIETRVIRERSRRKTFLSQHQHTDTQMLS